MTNSIKGNIITHQYILGAVDSDAAIETMVNRTILDVLPHLISGQMPVDRIASQALELAHMIEFHIRDMDRATMHEHRLTAKTIFYRTAIALNHDIMAEQPDLGTLVDGPSGEGLELPPVGIFQWLAQLYCCSRDSLDNDLLSLEGVVCRRGNGKTISFAPVH